MKAVLFFAALLFACSSCETTKKRKVVPPQGSEESNIPWNDPSLNAPTGGMMGQAMSR